MSEGRSGDEKIRWREGGVRDVGGALASSAGGGRVRRKVKSGDGLGYGSRQGCGRTCRARSRLGRAGIAPGTPGDAHLALHTFVLQLPLFCAFLALGYVALTLLALLEHALLQILQLVLEEGPGETAGPAGTYQGSGPEQPAQLQTAGPSCGVPGGRREELRDS